MQVQLDHKREPDVKAKEVWSELKHLYNLSLNIYLYYILIYIYRELETFHLHISWDLF